MKKVIVKKNRYVDSVSLMGVSERVTAMEGIENVKLLDIKRAVGVHLTDDGVHLTYEGQENWYKALVANAEDNNIPQ